jgi:ribosomal protein S18 acetylase RimI-like enzyme
MKIKIRHSKPEDIDNVYNLHTQCFVSYDHWYKAAIRNYLDNGIIIENKADNMIIGVLLQGMMRPCNDMIEIDDMNEYKEDIFEPVNEIGKNFYINKTHKRELHGIMMICVHPNFRGKGLGQKLIEKHFLENKEKIICLNTRRSNINAYSLYKKMGYIQIAFIKNKYFQPDEDSIFMIKDLTSY